MASLNTNRKAVSRRPEKWLRRGLAQPLRSSGTCSKSDAALFSRVGPPRSTTDLATDLEPEIGSINQRSVRARGWSALTQIVVMIDTRGVLYAAYVWRDKSSEVEASPRLECADFRKATSLKGRSPPCYFSG